MGCCSQACLCQDGIGCCDGFCQSKCTLACSHADPSWCCCCCHTDKDYTYDGRGKVVPLAKVRHTSSKRHGSAVSVL
jgi:hypothetical protein